MQRGKTTLIRSRKHGEDLHLISEVSHMVNLSPKRIREYEKEGFIKPLREKNTNNRLYSSFDISQINQINTLLHEHGLTLAGLRKIMVMGKCWDIFSCPRKNGCPAFYSPRRLCYEVRHEVGCLNEERCSICPIYLNKNVSPGKILNQPAFDD